MTVHIDRMYKDGFVVSCGCDHTLPPKTREYAWRTRGSLLVQAIEKAGHKVDWSAWGGGDFTGRTFVVYLKEE